MKKMTQAMILYTAPAITLMAACTYLQGGIGAKCLDDSHCTTYRTPNPVTCFDAGSSTSAKPGNSTTNRVTVTIYSGGTCANGFCYGGTPFSMHQKEIVDNYCEGCGS